MYRFLVLVLGVALFSLTGCGPKEDKAEFSPESIDMMAENNTTANATVVEANATVAAPVTVGNATMTTEAPAAKEEFKVNGEEIQKALIKLGLYKGAIDGKIGPKTKQSIEWFQTKNGLNSDGKIGPKTWAKIQEAVSALTSAVPVAAEPVKGKKSKKSKSKK
jgi:peptidoglycan hydrolase-like protein with peptidoglycan-binding domain